VSPGGRHHGAYQFVASTWDEVARQVGRPDLVGLAPSRAAPADQDALALALWRAAGARPWPTCGYLLG
jgi:muramidase (phage lysozyme)